MSLTWSTLIYVDPSHTTSGERPNTTPLLVGGTESRNLRLSRKTNTTHSRLDVRSSSRGRVGEERSWVRPGTDRSTMVPSGYFRVQTNRVLNRDRRDGEDLSVPYELSNVTGCPGSSLRNSHRGGRIVWGLRVSPSFSGRRERRTSRPYPVPSRRDEVRGTCTGTRVRDLRGGEGGSSLQVSDHAGLTSRGPW